MQKLEDSQFEVMDRHEDGDNTTTGVEAKLNSNDKGGFSSWAYWGAPRLIWIIELILLDTWNNQAEGGYGVSSSNVFSYHSMLMSLAVIFAIGESILIHNNPIVPKRFLDKLKLKAVFIHIFFNMVFWVLVILALVAIGFYKQWNSSTLGSTETGYPFWTLYSSHSWCGIVFLTLVFGQAVSKLLMGVGLFPAPKKNVHKVVGVLLLNIGCAVCAMGYQDMQSSDLSVDVDSMAYWPWSNVSNLACVGSIFFYMYGFVVSLQVLL